MRPSTPWSICLCLLALPAGAMAADVPLRTGAPEVFVHLDAGSVAVHLIRLTDRPGAGPLREWVCGVPCDRWIPGGVENRYYVGGSGVRPSGVFDFSQHGDSVRVRVRAGSVARRRSAWFIGAVGLVGLAAGGAIHREGTRIRATPMPFPHPADPEPHSPTANVETGTLLQKVGLVGGAVGAVGVGLGLVLGAASGTHLSLERAATPASSDHREASLGRSAQGVEET